MAYDMIALAGLNLAQLQHRRYMGYSLWSAVTIVNPFKDIELDQVKAYAWPTACPRAVIDTQSENPFVSDWLS